MSNDNTTPISEMKYAELQALAKERNLNASGTKEKLVARLTEANDGAAAQDGGADSSDADTNESSDSKEVKESDGAPEQEAPKTDETPKSISPVQERGEQKKADKALRADAKAMKAHLDSQKKVSIMVPFEVGENAEQGKDIPFHCNLNGYVMDIPRGVYTEVPMQIADLIKERLESEGKIGSQWRIDANAQKTEALS